MKNFLYLMILMTSSWMKPVQAFSVNSGPIVPIVKKSAQLVGTVAQNIVMVKAATNRVVHVKNGKTDLTLLKKVVELL